MTEWSLTSKLNILNHSTNMQVIFVLYKYIKANITTHSKLLLVYIDAVCFGIHGKLLQI